MRQLSLLALAIAIALTAGLVAVFGGQRLAVETVEPPRFVMAVVENSTTSTLAMVLDFTVGIDHAEMESLEAVIEESTTTTTTTAPSTTTTAAPSPKAKPKPPTSPTTTTTAPKATTTTQATPTGGFNSSFEADFYGRINALRSGNGLAALARNGQLDSYARDWAKWMGTNSTLKHSSYPSQLVPPWNSAGETVGKGGSVSSLFDAFKSSGGHRAIILGNFTHVGIGAWVDGNGTIWTAHLFAQG